MQKTSKSVSNSKLLKLISLALVSLFCLVFILFSGAGITKAKSVESELEVKVGEVLSLILTNCDNTNSSVLNINVTPSSAGVFKSNCQSAEVDTNAPGYSLSVYHRNGLPPIETPTTVIGIVCYIDVYDQSHAPLMTCKDENSNTLCLISEGDLDPETFTIPCKAPVTQNEVCRVDMNTVVPPDFPCEGETTSIITTYSNELVYQNPTTIDPLPTIPSTTSPISSPNTIANNTWGFAVEELSPFDANYAIDNASNNYSELPTENTTIYQESGWPLTKTAHNFYYSTKLTTETVAGTYGTTITYTAIGEPVVPVPCGGSGICIEITNPGELWLSNLWTSAITYAINGSDPITIEAATSSDDFSVSNGDIIEIVESIDNTTFRSWAGPQFGVDNNQYCGLASTYAASKTTAASIIKMPAMSRFTTDTTGTTAGDYFFASFASVCSEAYPIINSLPNGSFDTSKITTVGNNFFSNFNSYGSLTSLPSGSFDTSNITTIGDNFFSYFNSSGSLTSLPSGSFNTSKITTVGDNFFSSFNSNNGSLTSLPSGSFNTSNITTVGNSFFFVFNSVGSLTSLPSGSFDTSNITTVGNRFFYSFNSSGSLTSLPPGSFNTRNITTVGNDFFYGFNSSRSLTSLPSGSFDTRNITTVGDNFFSYFNSSGSLTSLPSGSFDTSKITTVGNRFFYSFNSSGSLTSLPAGSFDTSNITRTGNNFFFNFNGSSAADAGKLQAGTGIIITNKHISTVIFWRRPFGDPSGTATSTNVPFNGTITYLGE